MDCDKTNLGGWAIGVNVYDWIVNNIPAGSVIVELGSGSGSHELGKIYNMFCVEHDPQYVGKYKNLNYIYAPIVDGWYEPSFIDMLPIGAALLIIDAPPAIIGRSGFLKHSERFDTRCPILVDDTNRLEELELAFAIRVKHGKEITATLYDEDKAALVLS